MELTVLKEVIEALSGERRVFHYFPDRYAVMLLSDYLGDKAVTIAELKQSPYAKLLNKAPVKEALAMAGGGRLTRQHLALVWQPEALNFVTTLTQWGQGKRGMSWTQMSRSGYHLVLQLNMATDHTQQYQRLLKPEEPHAFNYGGHPVLLEGDRETLAWVRLDFDFETNEALIEEIQCDWIREARSAVKHGYCWYGDYEQEDLEEYVNEVLSPYMKVWEEAMLAAAIDFIRHELGIEHIFYHSFETGALLKRIKYTKPPRSLYTKLPTRFAFQKTTQDPTFLMQERRVQKIVKRAQEPVWFTLPNAA